LQNCNKVILEPVEGVRLQTARALNATPTEYLGACPEISPPLRLCYFALTFFHAVVHQRNNYGALGWNRPYEFTSADHHSSRLAILSVLKELRGDADRLPEALGQMRYIIGELVYGGKISDGQDRMISQDLIETIF
jgi:dynein heavy chain, axonemal